MDIPLPPSPSRGDSNDYSPSQVTSPHSDTEDVAAKAPPPLPPPPLPPQPPPSVVKSKVLGRDKAMKRLEAFAAAKTGAGVSFGINKRNKVKPATAFDDEEELHKDTKESTHHKVVLPQPSSSQQVADRPKPASSVHATVASAKMNIESIIEEERMEEHLAYKGFLPNKAGSMFLMSKTAAGPVDAVVENAKKAAEAAAALAEANMKAGISRPAVMDQMGFITSAGRIETPEVKEAKRERDRKSDSRRRRRSRSRSRSRDRSSNSKKRRSKSPASKRREEHKKGLKEMPNSWPEIKAKKLDVSRGEFSRLKRAFASKKSDESSRKLKHNMVAKTGDGNDFSVDPYARECEVAIKRLNRDHKIKADDVHKDYSFKEFAAKGIRKTKASPTIEWSCNPNHVSANFKNRKELLESEATENVKQIKAFIDGQCEKQEQEEQEEPVSKVGWYARTDDFLVPDAGPTVFANQLAAAPEDSTEEEAATRKKKKKKALSEDEMDKVINLLLNAPDEKKKKKKNKKKEEDSDDLKGKKKKKKKTAKDSIEATEEAAKKKGKKKKKADSIVDSPSKKKKKKGKKSKKDDSQNDSSPLMDEHRSDDAAMSSTSIVGNIGSWADPMKLADLNERPPLTNKLMSMAGYSGGSAASNSKDDRRSPSPARKRSRSSRSKESSSRPAEDPRSPSPLPTTYKRDPGTSRGRGGPQKTTPPEQQLPSSSPPTDPRLRLGRQAQDGGVSGGESHKPRSGPRTPSPPPTQVQQQRPRTGPRTPSPRPSPARRGPRTPPSHGKEPLSDAWRPPSPRYSRDHRPPSPSMDRGRRSPYTPPPPGHLRRRSPSPRRGRRSPSPPGYRGRRSRSPSPRYRGGRRSPHYRSRRSPSPGGRPYRHHSPSPGRYRSSRHSGDYRGNDSGSFRLERSVADSTISDAELLSAHRGAPLNFLDQALAPPYYPHDAAGGLNSPKRLSLDERLGGELGIKVREDQVPDVSRPPPGYLPTGQRLAGQQRSSSSSHVGAHHTSQHQEPSSYVRKSGLPAATAAAAAAATTKLGHVPQCPPSGGQAVAGPPEEGRLVGVGNMLQIVPDGGGEQQQQVSPTPAKQRPSPQNPLIVPPPVSSKTQEESKAKELMRKIEEQKKKKEAERRLKREQRMAERLQQQQQQHKGEPELVEVKAPTAGRILETIEKEEDLEAREARILEEAISTVPEMDGEEAAAAAEHASVLLQNEAQAMSVEKRAKLKKGKDPVRYISLKPLTKKERKRQQKMAAQLEQEEEEAAAAAAAAEEEEEFVARSPVPLPDASTLKPILCHLGFSAGGDGGDKKVLRYADGVLPGQGSPDHHPSADSSPQPPPSANKRKRKRINLKVYFTKYADESSDSDDGVVPPPPPGTPKLYHKQDFITKFACKELMAAAAN